MADRRKLAAAIDATLKKVDENIEEFRDMWNKIDEIANQGGGNKDKDQATLKKEIKKLQRYREDIMKWLSASEVKDKSKLIEARRKIETEMERFKDYERNAKTKPFSYVGLQLDTSDPKEVAKQAARQRLEERLDAIKSSTDIHSAEVEQILVNSPPPAPSGKDKKVKKDKKATASVTKNGVEVVSFSISYLIFAPQDPLIAHLSKDNQQKYTLLKTHMRNNGSVQLGLEIIMRKLENDSFDLDEESTKDMFDELDENLVYYLESKPWPGADYTCPFRCR
jgi:CCR4-NOT transcriptional regulation complex NOT5 subunit